MKTTGFQQMKGYQVPGIFNNELGETMFSFVSRVKSIRSIFLFFLLMYPGSASVDRERHHATSYRRIVITSTRCHTIHDVRQR